LANYLFVKSELCTGCRTCESVCSMTNERILNKAKSRIRILRTDVLTLSQRVCDQCEPRPCSTVCPEGAVYEKDSQVRVDREKCSGCGECVKVCDKLFLSPEGSKALMCNQCGACIRFCPEGALEMRENAC
jgi:anaerobic carbon-monoxide dehydrogenase iron sulfur subunit